MGKTLRFDTQTPGLQRVEQVIDQILAQPAAARFIADKLFHYFIHDRPDAQTLDNLAAVFRNNAYHIRPLLSALFRLPEFTDEQTLASRGRYPLEWLLATVSALGVPIKSMDHDAYLNAAAQQPFDPPNVAGWPLGPMWLGVPQAMARHKLAVLPFSWPDKHKLLKQAQTSPNSVATVLAALSLPTVTDPTREQLNGTADVNVDNPLDRTRLLWALALSAPEFALT